MGRDFFGVEGSSGGVRLDVFEMAIGVASPILVDSENVELRGVASSKDLADESKDDSVCGGEAGGVGLCVLLSVEDGVRRGVAVAAVGRGGKGSFGGFDGLKAEGEEYEEGARGGRRMFDDGSSSLTEFVLPLLPFLILNGSVPPPVPSLGT